MFRLLLEILLDELDLRRHLREVLVVEQRGLEPLGVARLGQELLGLGRLVLPVGAELGRRGRLVLEVDVRDSPAEDAVALVDRVDLPLAIDGHGDGAAHAHVVEGRPVLGQGQAERRLEELELFDDRGRVRLADGLRRRPGSPPGGCRSARCGRPPSGWPHPAWRRWCTRRCTGGPCRSSPGCRPSTAFTLRVFSFRT